MKRLRKLSEVPVPKVKKMATKGKRKKLEVVEEEESSESTHVDEQLVDTTVDEDYIAQAEKEKEVDE